MDFSISCSHCRRILVDWEDKGLLDLLDMDHVMCGLGGNGEQITDIRNCTDCPHATIVDGEEMSDVELKEWIRWSIFRRFSFGDTEASSEEQHGAENSEE